MMQYVKYKGKFSSSRIKTDFFGTLTFATTRKGKGKKENP